MTSRLLLLPLAFIALGSPLRAFDHDSPASTTKAFCEALNDKDKSEIEQFFSSETLSRNGDAQNQELLLNYEVGVSHGQKISGIKVLHIYSYGNTAAALTVVHYAGGGANMFQFSFVRENGDWKLVI
jgi:hypothetical protein